MEMTHDDKLLLIKIIALCGDKSPEEREYAIATILTSETFEEMKEKMQNRYDKTYD